VPRPELTSTEKPLAQHLRDGRRAEQIAEKFLHNKGLQCLDKNYRCIFGELDLVMTHGSELVVVEIRYRAKASCVTPAETITAAKRRRITRTTEHFLQRKPEWADQPLRFDVIALQGPLNAPRIEWIRNAFTTEDC